MNLNGGELYLGSGGIVKNGAPALVTTITLTSGTLGAKANWSSAQPITLNGNTTLKAANATDASFAISLSGVISGSGGFTKTGAGSVTLDGASTFTGATSVNAGALIVNGSIGTGATFTVAGDGTLAGTGTISRTVTLNSGGQISPATSATAGTLTSNALTWNGGGRLSLDLGAINSSDKLVLTGAFTKGSAGTYEVAVNPIAGFAAGQTYTLATFASSTFTASDFTASGLPAGMTATFLVSGNTLQLTIANASGYAVWVAANGLPAGLSGAADDADGDGAQNLLEYFLGTHPMISAPEPMAMNLEGEFHIFRFTRAKEAAAVNYLVEISTDLLSWAPSSVAPALESATATTETWIVKLPISGGKTFARLIVTLP